MIRTPISVSQLAELVGVNPARFVAIERQGVHGHPGWVIVTEDEMQTIGTFPQLADNTRRKPTKKGTRKARA